MAIVLPEYLPLPIREQFEEIIGAVSRNIPEDIEEVFPSIELVYEGPSYPNIWLFTSTFIVQVQRPSINNRIQHDIAPFAGLVDWVRLTARNYDFADGEGNSELDLEFTTNGGLGGTLSTRGEGCKHLMDIYRRRFLDDLVGTYGTSELTE